MDDGAGREPPYATVILIHGLTENPIYGPYIRGRLALAHVTLQTPIRQWLDAVYATWVDAPHEVLEKAAKSMTLRSAMLRPDRSTWGKLPEHRALAGKLGQGAGMEAGAGAPPAPTRKGPARPTPRQAPR